MGSALTVSNIFTLTAGELITGANTLTLNGTVVYTAAKISTA
jgi:hypothetical protein